MNKRKYIKWGLDFVFLTALAIILSQQMWSRYWVAVPIICILTLKVFEYMAAVAEKHLRVRAQLSLLMTLTPFEDVHGLRCTYHVPIWRKRFVQTCDYIPTGGGGRRKFSRTKGIIGAAFEEKKVLVENFSSDEEYRRQMVQKYNYTPEELRLRRADRRSYLCYPIVDENHKTHGLVYCDSVQINTFTLDRGNERVRMIVRASESIKGLLL